VFLISTIRAKIVLLPGIVEASMMIKLNKDKNRSGLRWKNFDLRGKHSYRRRPTIILVLDSVIILVNIKSMYIQPIHTTSLT
jgi:hypothetical protein